MLHYGLCAICFMKRILFYIICEKCGRDLILFFPFWPREGCASFLSDQLFIFGLPNVVLSTGLFYVSHALIQQIMSALPTSLTLAVLLLCWVLLKRLSAPCVNTFLCGQ